MKYHALQILKDKTFLIHSRSEYFNRLNVDWNETDIVFYDFKSINEAIDYGDSWLKIMKARSK